MRKDSEAESNARWANGLNVIAALWLLVSPFIMTVGTAAVRANDIWLGIIIGVLALIRYFVVNRSSAWLSWINMILGAWLIVSPLFITYTVTGQIWNDVITGAVVIALSAWSVSSTRHLEERSPQEAHEHVSQ
jgi:hypothetical protein